METKLPMDPQRALLNEGEDDEMEIFGYKTHGFRRALCLAGYVLSCGGLLLLFHWKPEWDVWANCQPCSLEEADVVLLRTTDESKRYTRKRVICLDFRDLLGCEESDQGFSKEKHSVLWKAIKMPDMKGRYVQVQKIRYLWDFSEKQFARAGSLEDGNTCYQVHHQFGGGLERREKALRSSVCGPNAIEIEIRPIWKLLFKEILNPFYVFQAFTLILWYTQGYMVYSSAIIVLSVISIGLTIYDLRQQSIKLHNLVKEHNQVQVTVWTKDEGSSTMESHHLVPGDLLLLEGQRFSLPCDAILLEGSCVVNEGMLTGESVPVSKTPLPHFNNTLPWKVYGMGDYRRHVLFCGTEVIQTRRAGPGPVRAVVLQTGFNTTKGELVRSILYPKPVNFRLYQEAFRFIVGLAVIGILGMIYTICVYVIQEQSASDTVGMALLLLTVPIPPVLPAALTTSIVYAQRRLTRRKIFCISPQRINICGQVNLVCFDKTGTLTEDGLDLWGALPCQNQSFQSTHSFLGSPLPWGPLCRAMASCHSLLLLEGKIQGDPLDLKMFEGTNWEMEEHRPDKSRASLPESCLLVKPGSAAPPAPVEGILILHQFPFSSSLLRMSVITQELGKSDFELYMKGAPETVAGFCEERTVPTIFQAELKHFTTQGFRVIGLAHKKLDLPQGVVFSDLKREEVESGLTFLGLLVMENRLKSETKPVLQELRQARIRSVMVTGDNLPTAITVARSSGMLPSPSQVVLVDAQEPGDSCPASVTWQLVEEEEAPSLMGKDKDPPITLEDPSAEEEGERFHFVLSGASYQVLVKHFSSLLPKVLLNGTIFARMSPAQKSSLVEEFQKLDYYVAMCGDGANDCGALKMAHAGISLSEQEASVASPFTSQIPNIECVPAVIREGRASLVASFAVFKYLTLYTLTQFIAIVLLYWQLQILGNYQFLIQDLSITLVVCLTMNLTHAYPKLAPYRPPGRLLSPPLLLSVLFNVALSFLLQLFGFLYVKQQSWYWQLRGHCGCPLGNQTTCPGNGTANATAQEHSILSYETATLFPLVSVSCIIFAFVFSKGRPFRKPIYTNYIFSGMLCLQLTVVLFLLFADLQGVYQRMEILCTPTIWRVYVLIMLLVTFLLSFLVEDGILQNRRLWLLIKALCRFRSSSRYRVLQRQLEGDAMWPPLHGRDLADDSSSSQAHLNPAYEPEQPAGHLESCPETALEGSGCQASPAKSRKDDQDPQETRCWHRCSEGTLPRVAAP
ncbi:probable cation-transporting ATPase 13A5 isoform X1 [Crotalus tigris]|uniref:probable cation-transporting ATPase 13A5 isoform X1 n=1 Tax=Crotalus tigris TaxID=88082 RepID=UPI00192F1A6F|nr:probable cation-transporting ATPase 13A5 isoform X1 [Crotalus tigris]